MTKVFTYKSVIITLCIISIFLGVALHFAFDISNQNTLVGLFTPVNESVWEHLKLILIPFTLSCIFFYFYSKKRFSNLFLITFLGNIIGMAITTSLYYIGTLIFTTDNMIFNIIAFILGISAAFYTLYLSIYNEGFFENSKESSLVGICALSLLFATFIIGTFSPVRITATLDPITKTYGIYKQL